jgi:hypothetical protein
VDPAHASYDVVFTAVGRKTSVVSAVPAAPNVTTTIGSSNAAIAMTESNSGAVTGRVTLPGPAAVPSVRAVQEVTATLKFEVAHANTNLLGNYSLSLPLQPPLTTPYAVPLGVFTSQVGAKYNLEASASGYQPATILNVTPPATNQDFTLFPAP